MKAKAEEKSASKLPRRHSEPTLLPNGDDSIDTERSLDTLSLRRKNRRRISGSRRSRIDEKQCDTADNATVLVTWREIITGILLACAFLVCMSVFLLLGDGSEVPSDATTSISHCESRTFLQQQLLSFMTKGEAHEDFSTCQDSLGINGTCSYTFNLCSDPPNLAITIGNLETILHILLVGALLTVMGVTVLIYDDVEDAMMQLWKAQSNVTSSHNRSFMSDYSEQVLWGGNASSGRGHNAMADLFPDVSVLFADIVGFEAWSSQREPTQCLTLLEAIYAEIDHLAKQQGIFKVEAVADCFTAAAGLPKARSDHAEALLQFAHDCCKCFKETTKDLEVTLGPDTSDLSLRVGIHRYVAIDRRGCVALPFPGWLLTQGPMLCCFLNHSGPVTALRGDRSRFQLFGEVVTTAQHIMHTSTAGKIQLSHETYQLLPPMLQEEWVTIENPTTMVAKGEDPVTKYWLTIPLDNDQSIHPNEVAREDDRLPRLVDWNVQLLKRVLNQIAAKRLACNLDLGSRSRSRSRSGSSASIRASSVNELAIDQRLRQGKLVIDEVEEVIQLPRYDAAVARAKETLKHEEAVRVSDVVVDQLREYIETIARSYKANPFHNFGKTTAATVVVHFDLFLN
jgi:class 3 adenylate cyclase